MPAKTAGEKVNSGTGRIRAIALAAIATLFIAAVIVSALGISHGGVEFTAKSGKVITLPTGEELALREEKRVEGKRVTGIRFKVLDEKFGPLLRKAPREGHKIGPIKFSFPSLERGVHEGFFEFEGEKFKVLYEVFDVIVGIEISGVLAPKTYDAYDPLPLYSAYVYIEWNPGGQPILVGVLNSNTGEGYGYICTGGYAGVTLTYANNYSHPHYVIIGNLGTETIAYKGYIDWWVP